MFILTLATTDPQQIANLLRTLADEIERPPNSDNALGQENVIDYEYMSLPEQKFLFMADFLIFNEDGNTLKVNNR